MDYDPFLFMQQNQKDYGFTISLKEYEVGWICCLQDPAEPV